ncbi:Cyclic pyranopterin phosphate synthase (MoaA) [Candidatus Burkholderia pumila]|uniref:Cyclic pyranopterin phosphate synthase (MoaA) n=1 Tax=Candidatus Burkholderia pumila TaxID=1090375 RepID=A0ABR5HPT7_9BURK|nr:Cyclic pyranopterin phosphate synthase (MoaA) [Candidatus Burkholderia pumila]
MSRCIIPLADVTAIPDFSDVAASPSGLLTDTLARPLRDLRISVTDRCNFRYCMLREVFDKHYQFFPHAASFEEIERLAALRTPEGRPLDLTLTTNGSLLARKAQSLKNAGLSRVTVSLDALDDALFRRMNDADFTVADVLRGIEAAQAAGLAPIKINMVVKRGTNDQEIVPTARPFKGSGAVLRFVEYMDVGMDVGASNSWNMSEVLPSAQVVERIDAHFPLATLEAHSAAETAQRWGYQDGSGEIGVISSVTRASCGDCTRARLSTEGKLYLCLFATLGHNLRALIRNGATDQEVATALIWQGRGDRYSQLRGSASAPARDDDERRVAMSYISG